MKRGFLGGGLSLKATKMEAKPKAAAQAKTAAEVKTAAEAKTWVDAQRANPLASNPRPTSLEAAPPLPKLTRVGDCRRPDGSIYNVLDMAAEREKKT
jgi:hypothetical protein